MHTRIFFVSGLVLVALAGVLTANRQSSVELFNAEDPDFFQADPVYSASPARDDSARVLYAVGSDQNDEEFPRAVLSAKPSTVVSPGAALSVLGGHTDDDVVSNDYAGALNDIHFAKGEMLASSTGMSKDKVEIYRGSLAGRARILKQLMAERNRRSASSSSSAERFPTKLQRQWDQQYQAQRTNPQESQQDREAREIRRRWVRDEQQQREDRRLYRDRRILYEEPGRPENVAHRKGAKRAAAKLLQAHKLAEEKREKEAIARRRREAREERRAKERREEKEQDQHDYSPDHDEHATSSHREVSRARKAHTDHHHQGFSFFDSDKSHIAAMRAVDEALDSHDEEDERDRETRSKVAEKLHSKADKLREVGEQEQTDSYSLRHKAERAKQRALESSKRAKRLQEKAARILEKADHRKDKSSSSSSEDVSALRRHADESATTKIRQALEHDERVQKEDELQMANEAVNAQSLLAHHKDISIAVQAKMDSLKKHIQHDKEAIRTDRAALENIASPGIVTQKLDVSPDTYHGAAYDAELRAKHLKKLSQHLLLRSKHLKEQAKQAKYAQKTIVLAAKCLEQQSEKLDNDEGPHDVQPHKLYALALKTCGLV